MPDGVLGVVGAGAAAVDVGRECDILAPVRRFASLCVRATLSLVLAETPRAARVVRSSLFFFFSLFFCHRAELFLILVVLIDGIVPISYLNTVFRLFPVFDTESAMIDTDVCESSVGGAIEFMAWDEVRSAPSRCCRSHLPPRPPCTAHPVTRTCAVPTVPHPLTLCTSWWPACAARHAPFSTPVFGFVPC